MKVDDDCFINLDRIRDIIDTSIDTEADSKRGVLIGFLWQGSRPIRDLNTFGTDTGRWLMPNYIFDKAVYPNYMGGPGYVMDRNAVECILQVMTAIKAYLPLDISKALYGQLIT